MRKRLLLAEQWDDFARAVLPPGCSPTQRREMRRAFYAGAEGMFRAAFSNLDPSKDPTDEDVAMLAGIQEELCDFVQHEKFRN